MCIVYHTYYHDTLYDSTQAGTNPKKELEREKSGGGGWWNDKRSWGTYNNVHQKNEVDLAEKLLKNDSGRQEGTSNVGVREKGRQKAGGRGSETPMIFYSFVHSFQHQVDHKSLYTGEGAHGFGLKL
eukprot:scaffold9446_cov99-Amphora_coffeaeformis.AAC.1